MKRIFSILLLLTILIATVFSPAVYATGDGNVDGGGGGMGSGTNQNFWNPSDEGVRVTVVRASDHAVVTTPIDFTNKKPSNSIVNFHKVSKIQYTDGTKLSPIMNGYTYVKPTQALPTIISEDKGNGNIQAIKRYFTDEQVIRSIANLTHFNFSTLINGSYKILISQSHISLLRVCG
jgi:hypothetical protein